TVRTRGAAYRMKVGTDDDAADAVDRGAIALASLAAHGLVCPRSLAIRLGLHDRVRRPTVAVESRLGTTDASVAWPVLGDVGRRAMLVAAVEGLRRIHALPEEVLPDGSIGSWRERVHRCADR